jgi:hypothetical protein
MGDRDQDKNARYISIRFWSDKARNYTKNTYLLEEAITHNRIVVHISDCP